VGFIVEFDAKHNVLRLTLEGHLTDAILLDAYYGKMCDSPSRVSRHY
jgi:hypothetical protein